jgi:hypothetical protein
MLLRELQAHVDRARCSPDALATQAQHDGRPGLVAGTAISSAPANGAAPLSEDTITPLFRGTLRTVAPRH